MFTSAVYHHNRVNVALLKAPLVREGMSVLATSSESLQMRPAIENTDQTENRYQKTHACIESESKVSEYKRARVC